MTCFSFGSKVRLFCLLLTMATAAPLLSAPAADSLSEIVVLQVDKAALKAELKTLPPHDKESMLLRSYRIAIGKEEGDKERQGDNRTPEGIYFTQSIINGGTLPAQKYGPLAIPLNFPNPVDSLDGKTGYGIWLHGAGEDKRIEEAKVTEGCVAFFNAEIRGLSSWLQPQQGIVVIAKQGQEINRREDREELWQTTQNWLDSWARRDSDRYMAHYAAQFESAGKNRKAYEEYKKAVFKGYKTMSVNMDLVRVITHPKYAVSVMNQDFQGDSHFRSVGRKILYWQKSPDGHWQIIREIFDQAKMKPLTFTPKDVASLLPAATTGG